MKALQRCNLRFSKGQIKLTCKDYSFILRCFLQMHPHRLAAQTFLWVVYWTMSHTAVQQPHWYKGIRRCYENMRGKKNTSFETDGFKEASQAESNYILLWSAWKKKWKYIFYSWLQWPGSVSVSRLASLNPPPPPHWTRHCMIDAIPSTRRRGSITQEEPGDSVPEEKWIFP